MVPVDVVCESECVISLLLFLFVATCSLSVVREYVVTVRELSCSVVTVRESSGESTPIIFRLRKIIGQLVLILAAFLKNELGEYSERKRTTSCMARLRHSK